MATNSSEEWEMYYKNEHKVYVDKKRNLAIETYVIMLMKKCEVAMGFKFVMRNLKNDLDFYSAHIIEPQYNDMKRTHNLYSEFRTLHKNVKMILEANIFDGNHVLMRLQENENGSLQIKILYSSGMHEDILLVYPVVVRTSYDILYFLKREMEFEANTGKQNLLRSKMLHKELQKEREKNEELLAQFQLNCDKITELETRNEEMWVENYQCRMHLIEVDGANKINFRHLLAAEETIKHLNRVIIELRTDPTSSTLGVPDFMRAVSSLSDDVETAVRTSMPRHQFFDLLDVFSTGVLELAKVGTRLTRVMATRQEPNSTNMQFRSAVLSQTRLITVMQDMWKGNRITIEEASVIRKMIEDVTYEIVRKYGNNPAERSFNIPVGDSRCTCRPADLVASVPDFGDVFEPLDIARLFEEGTPESTVPTGDVFEPLNITGLFEDDFGGIPEHTETIEYTSDLFRLFEEDFGGTPDSTEPTGDASGLPGSGGIPASER